MNTTDTRWVLDDGSLPRGFTYVFRVQAQNKNGWGPFSLNSSMFSYPSKFNITLLPERVRISNLTLCFVEHKYLYFI